MASGVFVAPPRPNVLEDGRDGAWRNGLKESSQPRLGDWTLLMQRPSRHGQREQASPSLTVTHASSRPHTFSPVSCATYTLSLGRRPPRHLHDDRRALPGRPEVFHPRPSQTEVAPLALVHTGGRRNGSLLEIASPAFDTAPWSWFAASALECPPPRQISLLARGPGAVSSRHDWCFFSCVVAPSISPSASGNTGRMLSHAHPWTLRPQWSAGCRHGPWIMALPLCLLLGPSPGEHA